MIIVQRQLGGLYYRTNVRTMASPATSRLAASLRPLSPPGKSRFDRRLAKILTHAINVFYEKGYEGASILNHLEYFLANQKAMKVLSHEDDVLKNGFGSEIRAIKREYYRICTVLLDDLKRKKILTFSTRTAVLSLFGIMNWIYTWYNPRVDGNAAKLAGEMGDIFLRGIRNGKNARKSAGVN